MAVPIPASYQEILVNRRKEAEALIERAVLKPFFLHHYVVLVLLPLLALVIPNHRSGITKSIRYLIFSIILGLGVQVIVQRRALLGACGYMIGLSTAWWIIWSATLLVFNDPEKNFKRIERRDVSAGSQKASKSIGNEHASPANGHSASDENQICGNGALRPRSRLDHEATAKQEVFVWQPYPSKLSHRVNWILGLIFNMRGPEWNWRISTLDPIPPSVQAQLDQLDLDHPSKSSTPETTTSRPDAKKRLRATIFKFCISYLALDTLKVLMMRDPYFWGVVSPLVPPPPPFPFHVLSPFPFLVRLYRLFLSAVGVFFALTFITSLNPIVFLGLSLAFPNASRAITPAPLDEPWIYANGFGPFLSSVMDNGLAGAWGQWWHQLFRFGFLSTARWLLSMLPKRISERPGVRRIMHAVVAFSLSGLLHATGSYTQIASTNPIGGPFSFFILQILGVVIQKFLRRAVLPRVFPAGLPRGLRQVSNFGFAMAWVIITGAFIADDFARGGLWLTEPIPVSPLRGLGLGAEGEGWWCWREPWFQYWDGGSWWESGMRVL